MEKLVATIRSREISACLVLQAQSQLKAIYKDNADTIIGNMDTSIFLGGKEPTTLKELAAVLGKETIDTYNTGESRGRETSHSLNKPTNRERLQEITAGIEQGIKELFESEKYMRYLSVMSKFHRYSVNNTMLIYMQRPDATLVAGFQKWKNQFERHVKKGEHGITIIAPTPYKKKIGEMKRDPDTQAPILDADGKAIMEEKEIEIPMFRPVKVFDVSQTDGKPLPELASSLSGTVPHYEAFMEALRRSAPVPIEFEAMAENMDSYFSPEQQRIAIRKGMSEVQTVSAAVHETAHSKLHDPKKNKPEPTWKIVMVSEGGTKHDYRLDFATEAEAEQDVAEDG